MEDLRLSEKCHPSSSRNDPKAEMNIFFELKRIFNTFINCHPDIAQNYKTQ